MRTVTERELNQARRLSQVLNFVTLGVGVLLAVLLVIAKARHWTWAETSFDILASALISAGLVSLILSRATIDESRLNLQGTIESAVEASLSPLREAIQQDSQSDYRWHCLISPTAPGETEHEYVNQQLSIEKVMGKLPADLRFVCIASMRDDALEATASDDRYQFRWLIDDHLDPHNAEHFNVISVTLNGKSLEPKPQRGDRAARDRHLVTYAIPKNLRLPEGNLLNFDVKVRKHLGEDQRLRIRTQLFRTTLGADFRCTISERIPLLKSWVSTTEVSTIGPMAPVTTQGSLQQGLPCSMRVRYTQPLQSGSAVGFHFIRAVQDDNH